MSDLAATEANAAASAASAARAEYEYGRLIVTLELSLGKLALLLAVCDDRNQQAQITQRYAQDLKPEGAAHYAVRLERRNPSLTAALRQVVAQQPQPTEPVGQLAVVTVQGAEDLLQLSGGGTPIAQQSQLFGYLQWTREALREFPFPVVLWLTHGLLVELVEQAPDFWSWRSGVFRFGAQPVLGERPEPPQLTPPPTPLPPELQALLEQIDRLQQLPQADEATLAALYTQLGRFYGERMDSGKARQFAIQALLAAVQLQRHLKDRLALAQNLEQLGNLYFELKDQVKPAQACYEEAIGIYREVGESPAETLRARLGEANTLKAIGDVLQFLDQRSEALDRYETAIGIYREVGARLGEANTLQAIGDVLQFLDQRSEALDRYETAIGIYREVGESPAETLRARLGEANTLKAIGDVLQFLDQRSEALDRYETAIGIYREVGARLGEANTLQAIGDVLQFLDQRSEALDRYETAIGIYREVGARLGEANTLQAIGDVLQFLDQRSEALDRYETAIGIYREVGARLGEANTLQAIGDVLQFLKQSRDALDRYETAIGIYREVGDRLGEANTLQAIGDVLQFLKQSRDALDRYETAIGIYRCLRPL